MRITTGTVIDGHIVVEGVPLVEGSIVTVIARGADDTFVFSGQDESDLLSSIEQIEAGYHISAEELLETLKRYG